MLQRLFPLLLATWKLSRVVSQEACCQERVVPGSDIKAGVYTLVSSSDQRCGDGCLYSRENSSSQVCFRSSPSYVTSCLASLSPVGVGVLTPGPGRTVALASTLAPSPAVPGGNQDPASTATTTAATPTSTTTTTGNTGTTLMDLSMWNTQAAIAPESIAKIGDWGGDEFCPYGSYATGLELKVAPLCSKRCSTDDDVAVGATRLTCSHYLAPNSAVATVTSREAVAVRKGGGRTLGYSWFPLQTCAASSFITSTRYLSEVFLTGGGATGGATSNVTCPEGIICNEGGSIANGNDPAGAVNMDMKCSDGSQLTGNSGISLGDKSGAYSLSAWVDCPTGSAVCGVRTRVQDGLTDGVSNLGQTELLLHCCQLPPPVNTAALSG